MKRGRETRSMTRMALAQPPLARAMAIPRAGFTSFDDIRKLCLPSAKCHENRFVVLRLVVCVVEDRTRTVHTVKSGEINSCMSIEGALALRYFLNIPKPDPILQSN